MGMQDPVAGRRPLAVGWATVELGRAVRELDHLLRPGGAFEDVPPSEHLGARCRAGPAGPGAPRDATMIVVMEPATEGRLAATLARHGEGWCATWEAAAPGEMATATPGTGQRPGPLGAERLISSRPASGPHRLRVEPDTIDLMHDPATTIRPATPADAETIAALFTDEGYPAGPSDIVERLARFDGPASRVLVAEHDGAVLGFIAVHDVPRFEHDDHIVRILALVVDAGARERGVGRALIAEVERLGTEQGAAFIEITAGHHRPEARRLYESLGYDATVTAYLRKRV